jgi:[ribosomal protein S18]-alanine N-acetyltransferase
MIRVRPARSEDLSRLREIASRSPTAAHWNEKDYAKLFSPGASPGLAALVIQEGNQVMGFLVGRQIAPNDPEWEIENVAVSGPARRRGLGSHLLGEFLRLVRDRGGQNVFLEVRESNQAARTLYEKWAFVETGRRKAYYQNPQEDAVILKFSFPLQG